MSAKTAPPPITTDVPRHEFLFGGIANSTSVFLLFPIHKTIFFQQLDGISWIKARNRLLREGLRLTYRGVLPPLLQRASSGSVMFGVQASTERLLHRKSSLPLLADKWIASVFAGWCEAPLMCFERVQSLLQNKKFLPAYRNTFHALAVIPKEHGLVELYRGFTPVLVRNSLANLLYFSGHSYLSQHRHRRSSEGRLERGLWNFALGGLLGGLIATCTFPLNVIKTRMQSRVGGQFYSIRSIARDLLYEKGSADITRFYRGVQVNFIRSLLSWGVITMTFHSLVELYSGLKV